MPSPKHQYHIPQGDPCFQCGAAKSAHRVSHKPQGDPCKRCTLPAYQHHVDKRTTRKKRRQNPNRDRGEKRFFIGIDGEGVGKTEHRYIMMGRAGARGTHPASIHAPPGGRLTSEQCLQFIVDCPNGSRIFSFAFSYDLTHILRDLPDRDIYRLLRPELRTLPNQDELPRRLQGPQPIKWNGFKINLISRKLVVQKGSRRRVVWDVFQFFNTSFVTALRNWNIGTADELNEMQLMKSNRSVFDDSDPNEIEKIKTYCLDECAKMAELASSLIQAHKDVGLELKAYFGCGSSASAALKKWGIDEAERGGPAAITLPVASAFFGGRFENFRVGVIDAPTIYSYDISSAYPYQLAQLPELATGEWTHCYDPTDNDIATASAALVRYSLPRIDCTSWGPFPFRTDDGSISFPGASGGGWLWGSEFLAGKRLFGKARAHEAWIYRTSSDEKPFAEITQLYLERLKLGKEGKGLVLKGAVNSCYGKTAQSQGHNPPFQSWIWAGMITAGTRAQLLDMMALHRSLDSVLWVATDGIYSTELVTPPPPIDTGTMTEHKKPLGGWEMSTIHGGMFAARPGIYFPLMEQGSADDRMKKIRARGVGRASMLQQYQRVIDAFNAKRSSVKMGHVSRFNGAKNTISFGNKSKFKRSKFYGQWTIETVELSFSAYPKRAKRKRDGSLTLRYFPGQESIPYDPANLSMESVTHKIADELIEQQPDGVDYSDVDADSVDVDGWDD